VQEELFIRKNDEPCKSAALDPRYGESLMINSLSLSFGCLRLASFLPSPLGSERGSFPSEWSQLQSERGRDRECLLHHVIVGGTYVRRIVALFLSLCWTDRCKYR